MTVPRRPKTLSRSFTSGLGVRSPCKRMWGTPRRWVPWPSAYPASLAPSTSHDLLPAPDGAQAVPQFYADTVVIAYRRAVSDVPVESLHPKVTASAGTPDRKSVV